jgi:hypothetical protein
MPVYFDRTDMVLLGFTFLFVVCSFVAGMYLGPNRPWHRFFLGLVAVLLVGEWLPLGKHELSARIAQTVLQLMCAGGFASRIKLAPRPVKIPAKAPGPLATKSDKTNAPAQVAATSSKPSGDPKPNGSEPKEPVGSSSEASSSRDVRPSRR